MDADRIKPSSAKQPISYLVTAAHRASVPALSRFFSPSFGIMGRRKDYRCCVLQRAECGDQILNFRKPKNPLSFEKIAGLQSGVPLQTHYHYHRA